MERGGGKVVGTYNKKQIALDVEFTKLMSLSRSSVIGSYKSISAGTLINQILWKGAATPIVDRYFVFVPIGESDNITKYLFEFGSSAFVNESLWLEFRDVRSYKSDAAQTIENLDDVVLFLLTREQSFMVRKNLSCLELDDQYFPGNFILPNEQIIGEDARSMPYRQILQHYRKELGGRIEANEIDRFQTCDSSDYIQGHGSPHAYFGVIHSSHKGRFRNSWIRVSALSGISGEGDKVSEALSFPILLEYNEKIDKRNIALDQTVSTAIGLNEGEVVSLEKLNTGAKSLRRRVFSFRHTIARVSSTNAMDMEKPIVRIEAGVQDILGVTTGERIVIESFDRSNNGLGRLVIRQLEDRGVVEDRSRGARNISSLTGDVDIPIVSMDLATRKLLGVQRGDAVYLRPSILAALVKEFSSLSLVMITSLVGALAANLPGVAIALGAIYASFAFATLWSKFK